MEMRSTELEMWLDTFAVTHERCAATAVSDTQYNAAVVLTLDTINHQSVTHPLHPSLPNVVVIIRNAQVSEIGEMAALQVCGTP